MRVCMCVWYRPNYGKMEDQVGGGGGGVFTESTLKLRYGMML